MELAVNNHTNLRPYNIELAKKMLTYCSDFTHIKKITGLSIKKMLELKLLEYYYPFKKRVMPLEKDEDGNFKEEVDLRTMWLRRKHGN